MSSGSGSQNKDLLFLALFGGAAGWVTGIAVRAVQNKAVVWAVAGGVVIIYVAHRQGYIRGMIQPDYDRLNADIPPITILTGLVFVGCFIIGNMLA